MKDISMTVHLIDFNRFEVYEAGAVLVSVLAYPGDSEEEKRAGVHASLCHHALRVKCEIEPNWALSPQPMKPIYALRTSREVKQDLRTLQRRLRDRLVAGRMAIGFLKEGAAGPVTERPAGLSRVSINQMARLVINDTGQTDPRKCRDPHLARKPASDSYSECGSALLMARRARNGQVGP
jgi:hypothetical protein